MSALAVLHTKKKHCGGFIVMEAQRGGKGGGAVKVDSPCSNKPVSIPRNMVYHRVRNQYYKN